VKKADVKATRRGPLLLAAALVASALAIFWPALAGGWLWDDQNLIGQNPALRNLRGLGQIWFAPTGPDYFPLTATVQWVQWHLWGAGAVGYHLTNVGLHALSAWLLWRLLRRLDLPLAWFGALVFLSHPVAVESVAWISELKNTLSLPFLLGAMIAYLDDDGAREVASGDGGGDARPGASGRWRNPKRTRAGGAPAPTSSYFLSLFLFLLAMLGKSSVVMFPGVLLLYAWWRRGRIARADVAASLPFFLVALLLGLVTWWFQQTRAIGLWPVAMGGPGARLAAAGLGLAFYLGKCAWPGGLAPIYPPWPVSPPSVLPLWPWLGLAAVAALAWTRRKSWGRHVLFGLGAFALMAAPILGFVPISFFMFAPVADHLAYLPLVAMAGLAAAGAGAATAGLRAAWRPWLPAGLVAVCAVLAGLSRRHAGIYRSETELWTYALRQNPGAWIAHYGLGNVQRDAGRPAEAVDEYEQALRINPGYAPAQLNLANVLATLPGRTPEALAHFDAALRINPRFDLAHLDLANVLAALPGRMPEALAHYEAALAVNPRYAEAENNLATALSVLPGRTPEALEHYQAALRINPRYAEVHDNLANLLAALPGRMPEALEHYQAALQIDPDFAVAHYNFAVALATLPGRVPEAIAQYEAALRIDPGYAEAHYNLAVAYARTGRYPEAIAHFEQALRLNPNLPRVRENIRQLQSLVP